MPQIVDDSWLQQAQLCKRLMAHYRQNQDLVAVGAYQAGSDQVLDVAIERMPIIKAMLRQGLSEGADIASSKKAMNDLFPGTGKA
jgi:flagellum-specific ATP synthase